MSVARVLRTQLPALALLALVLTACGDSDSDPSAAVDETPSSTAASESTPSAPASSATSEPSASPTGPACAAVWSDGATLPRVYVGCVSDSGEFVARDPLACSSGQRLIRFDNRYYAVPGGTIHRAAKPLDDDAEYRAAVARCRG